MTATALGRQSDGGFAEMRAAFSSGAAVCPEERSTRILRLLGRRVRLSIVGSRLAEIVHSAFAHLLENSRPENTAGDADAVIELWDRSAAPAQPPVLRPSSEWFENSADRSITAFQSFRYVAERRPGSLMWLDRATGTLIGAFDDARLFLLADRARPFSRSISELCRFLGGEAVHAALAGCSGFGILIVGGSGRGKTTSSLDCLAGNLDFLGDDTVAITAEKNDFVGHSLYASARVHMKQLTRWSSLAPHWIPPGSADDKAMLLPVAALHKHLPRSLPLAAIAIPRVSANNGAGPVSVQRTSGAEAFRALVLDSAENRRFALNRQQFDQFASLTRKIPSFRMDVSRDPSAVARGFHQVLREAQGAGV